MVSTYPLKISLKKSTTTKQLNVMENKVGRLLHIEEDERGITINVCGSLLNPRSKTVSISAVKDIWGQLGNSEY